MKKTFKIGEECVGGIIQVKINSKSSVIIVNCDFTTNAEVEIKMFRWPLDIFNIEMYLHGLTTSYYVSKIIDYIERKTK